MITKNIRLKQKNSFAMNFSIKGLEFDGIYMSIAPKFDNIWADTSSFMTVSTLDNTTSFNIVIKDDFIDKQTWKLGKYNIIAVHHGISRVIAAGDITIETDVDQSEYLPYQTFVVTSREAVPAPVEGDKYDESMLSLIDFYLTYGKQ